MKRRHRIAFALAAALGVGAAAVLPAQSAFGASAPRANPPKGTITVFAAASLTAAFTDAGKAFEAKYPGTTVKFNFAGSNLLVAQILQAAPANVFASADVENMNRLRDARMAAGPISIFTRNRLQIAVQKGNPQHITGLKDLSNTKLAVVLCAPGVPCGTYARQSLKLAGVSVRPKSNEANVKAVITRVATGEADAGIGYITDVLVEPKVSGVTIPDSQNVIATYPIATVKGSSNQDTSNAFIAFMLSADGQKILASYGFLPRS